MHPYPVLAASSLLLNKTLTFDASTILRVCPRRAPISSAHNPGAAPPMNYAELLERFVECEGDDQRAAELKAAEKAGERAECASVPETGPKGSPESTAVRSLHFQLLQGALRERDVQRKAALLERVCRGRWKPQSKPSGGVMGVRGDVAGGNERRRRIEGFKKAAATDDEEEESEETALDELIPCRLEMEHEGYKLSDVLLLSSQMFRRASSEMLNAVAWQLCADYDLPQDPFQVSVVRSLREQVEEWLLLWGAMQATAVPYEEIGPVPLRLDIVVGLLRLEDRVEVSLDPGISSSESLGRFVEEMVRDLGMDGGCRSLDTPTHSPATRQFHSLILHNLLEQLAMWRRSIIFGGFHRDARTGSLKFHDPELAGLLNDTLTQHAPPTVHRHPAHFSTFTPLVTEVSCDELERLEASRDRENRRKRRFGTAGGGNRKPSLATGAVAAPASTSAAPGAAVSNCVVGSVRSPPRTLPTPLTYRGSSHRMALNQRLLDNEGAPGGALNADDAAPARRGRKKR